MTTLIFGIASIGINAIHANVFDIDQDDKKYEKIKTIVKKIINYFEYTLHISYFSTFLHYIFLSRDIMPLNLSFCFKVGILSAAISYGIAFISSFVIEKFFTKNKVDNQQLDNLQREITVSKTTPSYTKEIFIKASIITNLFLLIITPQFSFIYIINALLLLKTYYDLNKQQWLRVTSSTNRNIITVNDDGFESSLYPFSRRRITDVSTKQFDISADLRLKRAPNHFAEECPICMENSSDKYYFCKRHIFDLGCILRHFSSTLENFNFSNLTRRHNYNAPDTISLDLDRSSLPNCPLCRDPYHESNVSISYHHIRDNPMPVEIDEI